MGRVSTRSTTGRPRRRPTVAAVFSSGERCTWWRLIFRRPWRRIFGRLRSGVPWYSVEGGSASSRPRSTGTLWPCWARIMVPERSKAKRFLSLRATTSSSSSRLMGNPRRADAVSRASTGTQPSGVSSSLSSPGLWRRYLLKYLLRDQIRRSLSLRTFGCYHPPAGLLGLAEQRRYERGALRAGATQLTF